MDIATILGIFLALFVLLIAIVFDFETFGVNFERIVFFIHVPSMLVVFGGTAASLAIEDALPSIDNIFLRNGLRLVVDRVDRELIIEILHSEMKYLDLRRDEEVTILQSAASFAPAYGMAGTLVGLILMLQNLTDPASIGPAMAIAIITTFYGVIAANVFLIPWKNKLAAKKEDDKILREMIRDGILYIEKGERPDFIEQDLMNYLSPELRSLYEEMKFESAKGTA